MRQAAFCGLYSLTLSPKLSPNEVRSIPFFLSRSLGSRIFLFFARWSFSAEGWFERRNLWHTIAYFRLQNYFMINTMFLNTRRLFMEGQAFRRRLCHNSMGWCGNRVLFSTEHCRQMYIPREYCAEGIFLVENRRTFKQKTLQKYILKSTI